METKFALMCRRQDHVRKKIRQYSLFIQSGILLPNEMLSIWRRVWKWFWADDSGSVRMLMLPAIREEEIKKVMTGDAWSMAPLALRKAILKKLKMEDNVDMVGNSDQG